MQPSKTISLPVTAGFIVFNLLFDSRGKLITYSAAKPN
jgi:hypothetical protein